MRAAEVETHVNVALSQPTEAERLSALLWSYVTAPPELRDTMFAEVAFRASWYDDAITSPSNYSAGSSDQDDGAQPASFLTRLLARLRRQDRRSRQSGS